jgi:arylsulfatase A-like enzyme
VQTPNLDALAQRGVRFREAYCASPLCGPSRLATMLGMRSTTTRLLQNVGFELQATEFMGVKILPKLLRDSGYHTAGIGKIFHLEQVHPDTWDFYSDPWRDLGIAYPPHPAPQDGYRTIYGGPYMNGPTGQLGRFEDTKYSDHAIQMIQTMPTPWFIGIGYVAPHVPYIYPEAFDSLYDPNVDVPPLPPEEASATWKNSVAPEMWFSDLYVDPAWGATLEERRRQTTVHYWRTITYIDHEVGRVLAQLSASGRQNDTIVVFVSDHGWTMGTHSRYGKLSPYESDMKAPLIVSVPWETGGAGQMCAQPVEHIDLYATVADYCGMAIPSQVEGESLRPQLQNPSQPTNPVFGVVTTDWESRWQRIVRTDRYKLVYHERGNQPLRHMFFDLQTDPGEYVNLYNDPGYATLVASHEQLLTNQGMTGADWSNYMDGRAGELGVPSLTLSASPVLGTSFDILIGNSASSPTMAFQVFGWATQHVEGPTVAGGPLLLSPWVVLGDLIPVGGMAKPFSLPNHPGFVGATLRVQVAELDAATQYGVSWSRGLRMYLKPY